MDNEPEFEALAPDAPGTIGEYVEDIRVSIFVLAAALLRSGALKPEQLHTEAQTLIDDAGGRTLNPDIYQVLHGLANISLRPLSKQDRLEQTP